VGGFGPPAMAPPRGPVSQSIVVTPGDTVVLTIPPM
jgi:hypothetical protein